MYPFMKYAKIFKASIRFSAGKKEQFTQNISCSWKVPVRRSKGLNAEKEFINDKISFEM